MSKFLVNLRAKGTSIVDTSANAWQNSLITSNIGAGKFGRDAINFPGTQGQKLYLLSNILYGVSEFTISFWLKWLNPNKNRSVACPFAFTKQFLTTNDNTNVYPILGNYLTYRSAADFYAGVSNFNSASISSSLGNYYSGKNNSLNTQDGTTEIYADNAKLLGAWNHIAAVYKTGTYNYFINGTQYGHSLINCQSAMNEVIQNKSMYTRLGSSPYGSETADYSSNMLIDDFCILDKALWTTDFTPPKNYLISDAECIKDTSDNIYGYK